MTPEFLMSVFLAALGAVGGGFGCYLAIRVDLAILRTRADHHEKRIDDAFDGIDDAHNRIDRVRRKEMDTR